MSNAVYPVGQSLPGFQSPGAGYDAPFAMLEACHERVQRSLALLIRVQEYVQKNGVDDKAKSAVRDVLRYFDLAAPLHHQDEELHVFPALMGQANSELQKCVHDLQAQHREMECGWGNMRKSLQKLLDWNAGDAGVREVLSSGSVDAFFALYQSHIQLEEQMAYPAAQSLLTPQHMEEMAADMMHRRGVKSKSL